MIRSALLTAAAGLGLAACVSTPVTTSNGSEAVQRNQPIPATGQGLNAYRSNSGAPAVKRSARLDAAARAHAIDMARNDFFSHRGSRGSTHTQRIQRQGCSGGAENIAEGPFTRQSVMAAWMRSPGHRANMLRPINTHYGIANVGDKWVLLLSRNCP
ncbi:CAP domain-containing protein [Maribius pontilimi]|uniref:CAP domain-containing protein n=1 Tax=Palleronia pontilimi TaxID=1964209 RepID=A0A934IFF1_9RHOB|nr:CAP domain-containing protein [Palleronia pontilimi]MBJ3762460.1 CAP domain-containing protein [Palleronia pontilimi]